MEAMITVHNILYEHNGAAFFPRNAATSLMNAVVAFLTHYTWLGLAADNNKDMLFSAAPQLHWHWHVGKRAVYLNPRKEACWMDEDFMKHMKSLVVGCTSGTPTHNVPISVIDKYRWGFSVESRQPA